MTLTRGGWCPEARVCDGPLPTHTAVGPGICSNKVKVNSNKVKVNSNKVNSNKVKINSEAKQKTINYYFFIWSSQFWIKDILLTVNIFRKQT